MFKFHTELHTESHTKSHTKSHTESHTTYTSRALRALHTSSHIIINQKPKKNGFKVKLRKDLDALRIIVSNLPGDIIKYIISYLGDDSIQTLLNCYIVFGNIILHDVRKQIINNKLYPNNPLCSPLTTLGLCQYIPKLLNFKNLIDEPMQNLLQLAQLFNTNEIIKKCVSYNSINKSLFLTHANGRRFLINLVKIINAKPLNMSYLLKSEQKINNQALFNITFKITNVCCILNFLQIANLSEAIESSYIDEYIFSVLRIYFKNITITHLSTKERAILIRACYHYSNTQEHSSKHPQYTYTYTDSYDSNNSNGKYGDNYDNTNNEENDDYNEEKYDDYYEGWSYLIMEALYHSSINILNIIAELNLFKSLCIESAHNYIDYFIVKNKPKLKKSFVTKYLELFIECNGYEDAMSKSIVFAIKNKAYEYLGIILSLQKNKELVSESSSISRNMLLNITHSNNNIVGYFDVNDTECFANMQNNLFILTVYSNIDLKLINDVTQLIVFNNYRVPQAQVNNRQYFVRYLQIVLSILRTTRECASDNSYSITVHKELLLTTYNYILKYNYIKINCDYYIDELEKNIPRSIPLLRIAIINLANKLITYEYEILQSSRLTKIMIDSQENYTINSHYFRVSAYYNVMEFLLNSKEILYCNTNFRTVLFENTTKNLTYSSNNNTDIMIKLRKSIYAVRKLIIKINNEINDIKNIKYINHTK